MHVVCVVVLSDVSPKRTYKNYYLGAEEKNTANAMAEVIAKKGFKSGDERFFPDQIESIVVKEREEV